VAYCSDRPWIINASVRGNIVLGAGSAYSTSSSSASEERYTAVVAACALDIDMAEWPAGDSTIIGEKGIIHAVLFKPMIVTLPCMLILRACCVRVQ
jgi:ABC-type transport system involved in cytochrome bd biosynthesis fused ATPase/permease subunit